ncbi:MAG: hypothetical protein GX620_09600 [Chloroflexi bacterium]|nr:hypothetical protein [Chloroflexota bacterium]
MNEAPSSEWRWALWIAVVAVLIASVPYIAGYLVQTPDRIFVGAVYDWEDYYSHLAKIQLGLRGSWRYRILFTPELHAGVYIYPFYLALGHLSRVLDASPILVYHTARVVAGGLLLYVAYWFLADFIVNRPVRRVAYLLVCCSSGLGWLVLLCTRSFTLSGVTPVDFWFIEINTFFTVLMFPHTCLALIGHLLAFSGVVKVIRGCGGWRVYVITANAMVGLALIHPYSLLPLSLPLVMYQVIWWVRERRLYVRRVLGAAALALLPVSIAIYNYVAISRSPVLSAWQVQNLTLSPPPIHYLSGYGIVLVLAIWGGVRVLRQRVDTLLPLVLWPLTVASLLYAPLVFNVQRRMVEGVHVPLCALAAVGLIDGLLPAIGRWSLTARITRWGYSWCRLSRLIRAAVLGFSAVSNVYLVAGLTVATARGYSSLFVSQAEKKAIQWLGASTSPDEVVLSSYEMGGYIPASIGQRVFWGHWCETVDLLRKRAEAQAFYGTDELDRCGLLRQYGISYVMLGPRERTIGPVNPEAVHCLRQAYVEQGVAIYAVVAEE